MNIFLNGALLIIGFITLWLSSEKAIVFCSRAAALFGLSELFIGFIVIAISSGLPELLVAIQSVNAHATELSIGNIIGSNLVNLSMALGIAVVFVGPIVIVRKDYIEQLVIFIASFLPMLFIFINGQVTRTMGIVLLITYLIGIVWLWYTTENEIYKYRMGNNPTPKHTSSILAHLIMYLFLVVASSKICLDNALILASYIHIPLAIVGVIIFGIGTALPEIAINIQAVRKKNYSLALSNSLGSVFSQGALIPGFLAVISPTSLSIEHLYAIIPFLIIAYSIVGYHLIFIKKIEKISGLLLIGSYLAFVYYEFLIVIKK